MSRKFLSAKIHRATLTGANLEYSGSLTIDAAILKKAGIAEFEQIHVFNVNNGARLITYAIKGESGKGQFELNGAAARLGMPGDKIIIVTYRTLEEKEIQGYKPKLLIMDEGNQIKQIL
ncbi:MAG: aspartate 1-decarboxylase [Acidobacteria bacterium]|nr:MAG: aspartate 1-decarboxylase [Acidobacteriota bacterium]